MFDPRQRAQPRRDPNARIPASVSSRHEAAAFTCYTPDDPRQLRLADRRPV